MVHLYYFYLRNTVRIVSHRHDPHLELMLSLYRLYIAAMPQIVKMPPPYQLYRSKSPERLELAPDPVQNK